MSGVKTSLCRTLMCRDRELLDFEVDSKTWNVESVRVLDESCLKQGVDTPSFVSRDKGSGSLASDVQRMLRRRGISPNRKDLPQILHATNAKNPTELALRSRGCSLSDQYWYRPHGSQERWRDINFFDNDWDHAFGNAVLTQNWSALARADLETPDITCSGWTRKSWIREDGSTKLLKASPINGAAHLEGELIVTRMLSRILNPSEFTQYEKIHRFNEDFIACNLMLGPAEEHVPADSLLGASVRPQGDFASSQSSSIVGAFARTLESLGVENTSRIAAQILVASTLTLSKDMHLYNFGAIRNVETGKYRASPLYDYGGAFGLGADPHRLEILCQNPMFLAITVVRMFSELDDGWDYSWYDPQALQGFDEELEDALLAMDGLPAGYPAIVRRIFSEQLAYVNKVAGS